MLTKKLFGFPDPRSLSRAQLWGCVAINQLAFPGLGTIIAGRRRVGCVQAALMVVGFTLVIGFLLWFLTCTARFLMNPNGDESQWRAQYRPFAWAWKSGLVLCAIAWCWALVSSIGIVRRMRSS